MKAARRIAIALAIAAPLVLAGTAAAGHGHRQGRTALHAHRAVCGRGFAAASCSASVVTNAAGKPFATTGPTGYGPVEFHTAYGLPAVPVAGQTIGIVDAYDAPTIANDLQAYSTAYGAAFTAAYKVSFACTGCLTKVNQNGAASPLPAKDPGWALEISLDVEVAHAICPSCKILLVEASSTSFAALGAAEDTAARLGANVISNSWGGSEFSTETSVSYDGHFNHPGVAITASSGDSGYGVSYPASSRYVTAVGGTTLTLNASKTRLNETAWSGAGSGCSAYEPKPTWQHDTGCPRRTVADVSADADPASGASVYDTTAYSGQSGWFRVGGTSLSSPLIAGVYALAGNAMTTVAGSFPYGSHTTPPALFDVLSGSNGRCSPAYLCASGPGYDGPTGLGAPNGIGGF